MRHHKKTNPIFFGLEKCHENCAKKAIRIFLDMKNVTTTGGNWSDLNFVTGLVVPSIALCNGGNLLFMTVIFFKFNLI